MQKWFALLNLNSFYEVSQKNVSIFYACQINYDNFKKILHLKRAMLESQWYRVYQIDDLKIPAFVHVCWTCHSIIGRSREIMFLVPLRHTLKN